MRDLTLTSPIGIHHPNIELSVRLLTGEADLLTIKGPRGMRVDEGAIAKLLYAGTVSVNRIDMHPRRINRSIWLDTCVNQPRFDGPLFRICARLAGRYA